MRSVRISAAFVLAAALAASCGGGSSPTSGTNTAPTTAGAAGTTTSAPGAAASSPPATAGGGANTSGNTDPCRFLTTAEVARVMKTTNVTTTPVPGDPGYCTYTDITGHTIVALSYIKSEGTAAFNTLALAFQPIAGFGDRAVWDTTAATLVILKGGTVLVLAAGDTSMEEESRQDLAKQLAAIAVPRQ